MDICISQSALGENNLPHENHDKNPKIRASQYHKYPKCNHHCYECDLLLNMSKILVHLEPTLILQLFFFPKMKLISFHWLFSPTNPALGQLKKFSHLWTMLRGIMLWCIWLEHNDLAFN
jgi:hypothetical protein